MYIRPETRPVEICFPVLIVNNSENVVRFPILRAYFLATACVHIHYRSPARPRSRVYNDPAPALSYILCIYTSWLQAIYLLFSCFSIQHTFRDMRSTACWFGTQKTFQHHYQRPMSDFCFSLPQYFQNPHPLHMWTFTFNYCWHSLHLEMSCWFIVSGGHSSFS